MNEENNAPEAPEAPATGGESLHDDISRAFEQVESREAPPDANKATPAPVTAPDEGQGERLRGPDGRFVPATPGAPKPASAPNAAPKGAPLAAPTVAQAPKPGAAPVAAPQQQLRPPASWKPGVREHWAKLPPEVQQEVVRREVEVTRTMQEAARAREGLTAVQNVLGPFQQNIAATGNDALGAIRNLFQADHTLRHGSTQEKAALAASIIKSYGVDLGTLDAILAGQIAPSDPNAALADRLRREMQQQLQPVMQYFGHQQAQRQSALAQINENASGEVESFGQDAAHEFFEDVREDMADIMDLHTARGMTISLQDAYDRAIQMHPQVREIVAKRAETERANAAAAAAQRARRTAASISSSPAPAGAVPGPAGNDRRAAIEAAWNDHSSS